MTPDQEKALRAELEEVRRALRDISVRASTIECGAHNGRLNADCTTCRDIAFIQSLTAGGDKSEEWTLRHENRSLRTALAAAQGALREAPHGPFCLSFTIVEGRYPVSRMDPPQMFYPRTPPDESLCNCWKRAALTTSGKPGGDGERDVLKAQIKHMVNRFLAWKLPADFSPDAGISFKATFNENTPFPARHEPTGTNLFDATQAEAMVRHMIEGMPAGEAGKPGGEARFKVPSIIPSSAMSRAERPTERERISPTPRLAEDDADTPEPGGEAQAGWVDAFRERVAAWVVHAFGDAALTDRWERTARMVEESIELAQAEGLTGWDVGRILDRVYDRPAGATSQEAAGLMVCFLAWAAGTGTDLRAVTLTEIERIERPEVTERIRAKQLDKAAAGTGKGYRAPAPPEGHPAPREGLCLTTDELWYLTGWLEGELENLAEDDPGTPLRPAIRSAYEKLHLEWTRRVAPKVLDGRTPAPEGRKP